MGFRRGCQASPLPFQSESCLKSLRKEGQKRNVLFQRSAGVEVETAQIETVGGDLLLASVGTRRSIDRNLVCAFPMPLRRDPESYRPVRRILPDWGIPIVHQLITVVFEFLSEIVEHRPSLVTGRASQSIFSGECR